MVNIFLQENLLLGQYSFLLLFYKQISIKGFYKGGVKEKVNFKKY